MAAEKLAPRDALAREVDDLALGAAGIGHQCAFRQQRIDVADRIENASNRLRQEYDIGLRHCFGERRGSIDGAGRDGFGRSPRRRNAGDRAGESSLPEGKAERGTDQPGTNNDEVGQTLLPTASAMMRSCAINSPNWSGRKLCAPSDRA